MRRVLYGWAATMMIVPAALPACTFDDLEAPTELTGTAEGALSCGGLAPGESLARGQSIRSCAGNVTLVHQTDGNVVLYDQVGASWHTSTAGRSDTTSFVMQSDGNLVLYATAGAIWSSGTWGHPGARLALQDNCNLLVRDIGDHPIWATSTFCRVNLALNPARSGYPSPSASYTSPYDTVWGPLDGTYGATPRWTSWNSMNAQDWYAVDLGGSKAFSQVKAYFYNDDGGVKPPTSYKIQYWNGASWVDAANQVKSPASPAAGLNTVTFTPVTASRVRILCTNQNPVGYGIYSGLTEFVVFNQLADDFNDGNAVGWTPYGGTWAVEGNEYSVEAGWGPKSVATGTNFANFTFEADVKVSSTASHANGGLIFRVSNPSTGYDTYHGYYVGISPGADRVVLGTANGSWWTQLTSAAMAIEPNVSYRLKILAFGPSIWVYVTDMINPKLTYTDSSYASGMIGVRSWDSHAHFDNIKVVAH